MIYSTHLADTLRGNTLHQNHLAQQVRDYMFVSVIVLLAVLIPQFQLLQLVVMFGIWCIIFFAFVEWINPLPFYIHSLLNLIAYISVSLVLTVLLGIAEWYFSMFAFAIGRFGWLYRYLNSVDLVPPPEPELHRRGQLLW